METGGSFGLKIHTYPDEFAAVVLSRLLGRPVKFIADHKAQPFFLYFAHTFPHTPLFASDRFKGKSGRGLYGDVVEELDWSVGQVLATLDRLKLTDNTLVIFFSDNGPFRHSKASLWEGGLRVPGIIEWPARITKPAITDIPANATLYNIPLKQPEIDDLNRGRIFLRTMARQHHIPVHTTVEAAVAAALVPAERISVLHGPMNEAEAAYARALGVRVWLALGRVLGEGLREGEDLTVTPGHGREPKSGNGIE